MRIAIVGAGNVGRAVGRAWTAAGHRVRYGVRDPARAADLPAVARVAEAVTDAEVVVLSVMFHTAEAALRDCGDLAGRILLDPTNPLAPDEGGLRLTLGFDTSAKIAGQLVQIQLDELGIDYIDRRSALIDAVSIEDVRRASKRLLDSGLLVTVVGRAQGANAQGAAARGQGG